MSYRTRTAIARHSRFTLLVALLAAFGLAGCAGEFQLEETLELEAAADGREASDSVADELPAVAFDGEEAATLPDSAEVAFIDREGDVFEVYFAGIPLTVEQIDGEFVYEGDILLPPNLVSLEPIDLVLEANEEPSAAATEYLLATRTADNRWPESTIPYQIDGNLQGVQRVKDAIAHWEANTNVRFVERSDQSDYIYFTAGSGCSSYIGRIGGRQSIWISDGCSTGSTIHEIGHALGAWHEHSRADRDQSIKINWDNIRSGKEHNFRTYAESGWDGEELTEGVDFGSIMMYSSYSFSANGQPTIVKLDGSVFYAQRKGLSPQDIEGFNKIYLAAETEGTTEEPEEAAPEVPAEPEYVNGEYYVISGLTVLRMYDRWYYYSRNYGWKEVVLRSGRWYYA